MTTKTKNCFYLAPATVLIAALLYGFVPEAFGQTVDSQKVQSKKAESTRASRVEKKPSRFLRVVNDDKGNPSSLQLRSPVFGPKKETSLST